MDTYEEIIRIMREMYQELKNDNDAHDSKQEAQEQTKKESKND